MSDESLRGGRLILRALLPLLVWGSCALRAQQMLPVAAEVRVELPDAPGVPPSAAEADTPAAAKVMASKRAKFIFPAQAAPPLTATDKVYLGLIHSISLYSATGWVIAAEYEHVTNGTPNFGTDAGAYGQRLGAAALRGSTEEILGTSVLAPLLHQDPRFYRMGPRRNVAVRAAYAITRTIVTRDDAGHLAPNYSLVGGNLAGAALTNAYYPEFNRGFNQTLKTFEGSMGGAAFGFLADEFIKDKLLSETMIAVHLKSR